MANKIDSLKRLAQSPRLRNKMLKFTDGKQQMLHYACNLNNMVDCERILDWLIFRGLVGTRFLEWVADKHNNSFLEMVQHVIMEVNRTATTKPVIVGKDYVSR